MLAQAGEGRLAGHAAHHMGALELHGVDDRLLHALHHGHGLVGGRVPHEVVALVVAQEHAVVIAHEERRHGVLQEEVLLVPAVLHDEVGHSERERRVTAGLDRDELVRKAGGAVEEQADVDDLGAVAARLNQVLGDALLVLDGVCAPHDDEVGAVEVGRVGGHVLVEVAHVVEGGVEGAVVKAVALDRVGGTPQAHEARGQHGTQALRGRHRGHHVPHGQRLRAVLVAQLKELGGYLVERLIPADLLPLALAALANALKRVQQALGVVGLAARHDALLADVALVRLGPGVAGLLCADDLAVLCDGLDGAELVVAPPGATGVDEGLPVSHNQPLSRIAFTVRLAGALLPYPALQGAPSTVLLCAAALATERSLYLLYLQPNVA